jgi:hypothetical protein
MPAIRWAGDCPPMSCSIFPLRGDARAHRMNAHRSDAQREAAFSGRKRVSSFSQKTKADFPPA